MDASENLLEEEFNHSNATSRIKQALPQIWAVMVKNIILMTYGMSYGFPTILIPGVSGHNPNEKFHLSEEELSWIGSISPIFSVFGCLCSGGISYAFGTKITMHYVSIAFLTSWLILKFSNAIWQVFFALSLGGFLGGLTESVILVYVAEITQPHLRGVLSASTIFATNFGLVLTFVFGTFLDWRNIAFLSCTLPIISFFLLFFIPESPHWLIIKHKATDARKSLLWLRATENIDDVEEEFQEILLCKKATNIVIEDSDLEECEEMQMPKEGIAVHLRNFRRKSFLWPFSIVSLAFFLVHFTGVSTLQTYAVQIFATLQVPLDEYHATVFFGIAKCAGSLACSFLIHHMGRRLICFVSMISSGISFGVVALYAYKMNIKNFKTSQALQNLNLQNADINNWVPLVLLNFSTFISACGLRALPWILIGEVYSNEARVTGTSVSGAVSYFFGFLTNKVFLQMVAKVTLPATYWFYGFMSLAGVLLLYLVLPETEGKTLKEISDHFASKSRLNQNKSKK